MKKLTLAAIVLFTIITSLIQTQAQTPTLWGMTTSGGVNKDGIIFNYNIATDTETDVHDFGSGTDGKSPWGSLIQAHNGLLYGMTAGGGAYTYGTIFSYDIDADTETDIHDFGMDTDGQTPYGSLTPVNDSLLFGMTPDGGTNSYGTIFRYNTSSGSYTVIHNFGNDTDGQSPQGSLLLVGDSVLYGMTHHGGSNGKGTMFSYNIKTGKETVLHSFGKGSDDGTYPYGSLIKAGNGLLYGMTTYGGSLVFGTIFSYNISTGAETVLHNFGGSASGPNGWYPYGSLLQASDSLIYGLTYQGGAVGAGLMYSYNISSSTYTDIHDFDVVDTDASGPYGTLIQASDSLLYGMTYWGGNAKSGGQGSIFSYNISKGTETVIHRFGNGTDGEFPYYGNLIEIDVVTTGVNRLTVESGQLTVYPNPSSDFFTVQLSLQQTQPLLLSLYNILGQQVWSTNIGNTTHIEATIPVTNLADGIYILKVNSGDTSQLREVVVAK